MGSDPTPFELRPRYSLTNEQNWQECLKQLYAAKVDPKLINRFSHEYGYASRAAEAIEIAAEHCGFTVHWTN